MKTYTQFKTVLPELYEGTQKAGFRSPPSPSPYSGKARSGNPRWITAEADGTDANGRAFKQGEKVLYHPNRRKTYSGPEAEKIWQASQAGRKDIAKVRSAKNESVNESVNESLKTRGQGADYDQASAESAIDRWKQDMSRLEDHMEFLKRKHKSMGIQLADAQKRYKTGDFRWISQNLYTLGDLF